MGEGREEFLSFMAMGVGWYGLREGWKVQEAVKVCLRSDAWSVDGEGTLCNSCSFALRGIVAVL